MLSALVAPIYRQVDFDYNFPQKVAIFDNYQR